MTFYSILEASLQQSIRARVEELSLPVSADIIDSYMLAIFAHYLDGIENKRILDIGCGGDYALAFGSGDKGTNYPPSFLRLAKSRGALPAGLDPSIRPGDEDFEVHCRRAESIGDILHSCYFDGVLVKLFYNTPDLGAGYGRHNNYAMHLQQRTYGQIHRILKPGGVSVNAMNADKNSGVTVPTEEFLESLGFKIELYSPGGNSYDDLVVVRKPLSVA